MRRFELFDQERYYKLDFHLISGVPAAALQCDDNATNIGSRMRNEIMMRYQLRTSTDASDHFRQLYHKQGYDDKIQDIFVGNTHHIIDILSICKASSKQRCTMQRC